jgi:hypothetical protein
MMIPKLRVCLRVCAGWAQRWLGAGCRVGVASRRRHCANRRVVAAVGACITSLHGSAQSKLWKDVTCYNFLRSFKGAELTQSSRQDRSKKPQLCVRGSRLSPTNFGEMFQPLFMSTHQNASPSSSCSGGARGRWRGCYGLWFDDDVDDLTGGKMC